MNAVLKAVLVVIFTCVVSMTTGSLFSLQETPHDAPEFSLTDFDGQPHALSDYKNKVVILNFWATWCGPCKKEIPHFNAAYEKFESEGLVIIGVSLDRREEAVRRFLQRTDLSYPVAMATPELVESYRPGNVIPVTFVIDKRGIIRSRHVGYMDEETLITTFKELSGEGKNQRGKDE